MTEVCIETQPRFKKKVGPVQSVLVILISRRLIMSASRLVVTSVSLSHSSFFITAINHSTIIKGNDYFWRKSIAFQRAGQ